jgi:hypothetical protein
MQATDFEYRHQTLVHQLLVGAAFLTYLIQTDDIVWRLVKDRAEPQVLERLLFIIAAIFIAFGAVLCTCARTDTWLYRYFRHPRPLGEFLYAIGLGSLASPVGFAVMVVGEGLRLLRLIRRENGPSSIPMEVADKQPPDPQWKSAFQREAVKWGVVVTMIAFVITLRDRVAEVLLVTSFLAGLLLNAPFFRNSQGIEGSA